MDTLRKAERSRDVERGISVLFDKANAEIEKIKNIENADYSKILSFKNTLSEKFEKLKTLDEAVMNFLLDKEDSDLDAEEQLSTDFSIMFKTEIIKIDSFIDKTVKIASSERSFSSSASASNVKLPHIEIKTFDGQPSNWQTFIDSFECAIDKNDSLSPIQKLTYLKNLVEKDAASTLEGTNNNYELVTNSYKFLHICKNLFLWK